MNKRVIAIHLPQFHRSWKMMSGGVKDLQNGRM